MCGQRTMEAPRDAQRRREQHDDLRVADADRERAVALLRAHAAAGRLDLDELEQRTGAALAARTGRDLGAITRDLPRLPRDRMPAWRAEVRIYLVVIAALVAVWLVTGAGHPWPVYPALGWGIPLLLSRPTATQATLPTLVTAQRGTLP